jgi:formate hydrogenlyase subunit 3/multisubunit Na+/H+ antiporter MnhD subunit
MSSGLAAPIIIPFTTAAIMLLGRRQLNFQHVSSMLAAVLHLATGAWLLYTVQSIRYPGAACRFLVGAVRHCTW